MKENNSVNNKMIDRNWVMKRKRNRLSCGPDQSTGNGGNSVPSESSRNLLPAKCRLKTDIQYVQSRTNGKEGNSLPSEFPRNHPHGKRRIKSDLIADRSSNKKKGNDGTDRTESGDSSKTHSDHCNTDRPEVEEISSEETVSDERGSEHEP